MREDMVPEPEDPYGIAKFAVELDLARRARHVRARLRRLPTAQRVRRVPEHRRPLPQRHRHLHEPADAGRAADRLRRRRRRRAPSATSATSRRSSPPRSTTPAAYNETFNIGADTPYTVNELAQAVMDAMGCAARSGTCRPATKRSTPSPTTARLAGCSVWNRGSRSKRASGEWRHGPRRLGRAGAAGSPG